MLTDSYDPGAATGIGSCEQAMDTVMRMRTAVEAQGQRLRGIGVTFSGDAAAPAALLLEALTDAGFDNVVAVRFRHAAEALPGDAEQAAVCLIEPGLATVLMASADDEDVPAVHQREIEPAAPDDEVIEWLATVFPADGPRPGTLIVSGPAAGLGALAARIEARLGLPVTAEAGAQLALARGAAQALGPDGEVSPELAEALTQPATPAQPGAAMARRWPLSYASALVMLVAGVLSFVVSLALALSLQLTAAAEAPSPQAAPQPVRAPRVAPIAPVAAPSLRPAAPPQQAPAPPEAVESVAEAPPPAAPSGAARDEPAAPPTEPEPAEPAGYPAALG